MSYNFADLFEHTVDAMPDRVALLDASRDITYRALEERANRLAHHLRAAGFGRDTHIGFHMHNSLETVETLLACYKIRAVPININFRYTADELHYVYDNADLEVLVHHRCYAPTIAEVLPRVPSIAHTLVVEDDLGGADLPCDALPYQKAVADCSVERDFGPRSPDDRFIMYTGGTTGKPKGVVWRQEDMWRVLGGGIDFYTGEVVADEFQQSRVGADAAPARWFALPPLIHAAAMMPTFYALWGGNSVVFTPKFNPAATWKLVARLRAQVLIITGDAMARPLIDAYRATPCDVSSLVAIASGAALLSQSVKNELLELFPKLVVSDSIGSSETGFGGMGFAERDEDPGHGPRVQIGRGAVVVDDGGHQVAPGQEGWLAKTGSVPIGYYNDPERSERLFKLVDGARMVITDDRGRVEPDGSVRLLGRGNMVINTGGEKVFAEEVEGVVKSYDGVYDAIVIGVPHERWGNQVAALIAPVDGAGLDFAGLAAHVRHHLAGYKVPRAIWLVDTVARTPSGKPDYSRAKAYAETRHPDHVGG